MFAVLMVLLSRLFYAGSNIMDAHVASNILKKLSTIVFYNGITNVIALPILFMIGMPQFGGISKEVAFLILTVSAIEVLYQFPYYKALKTIDTSIVTAMFSLGKIIIPVLAYFMIGEKLQTHQYIGFFIVIIFNLILNTSFSKESKYKLVFNSAFFMMLAISILLSFQGVFNKKALLQIDWITFYFWNVIISSALSFGILLLPKARKDIISTAPIFINKWKIFISMEMLNQGGALFGVFALSLLPVVVMKSISSMQPIIVLLLGVVLQKICGTSFKESIGKNDVIKKTICFAFIIFGVVLSVI